MAHELTINKFGKAEFFYCGDKPWHGLGTQLPQHATSRQALQAAGLDWSVLPEPLYLHNPDGTQVVCEDAVANVRQDTREILGVVTPDFKLIQNLQAMTMLDELVGQAHAMFETAGSLRGGRKIFATAKLPTQYVVGPDDALDQYLLMVNAHDGSSQYHIRFTGVRVVCNNTLNCALAGATPRQVSIRHTANAEVRMEEIRRVLGISVNYFNLMGQKCEALTLAKISDRMQSEYLDSVFPVPTGEEVTRAQVESVRATQETIAFLFREGRGNSLPSAKGTAWGLFNATSEYLDHVAPLTKKGTVKASGFETALFGSGDTLRQRAWDEALALLTA